MKPMGALSSLQHCKGSPAANGSPLDVNCEFNHTGVCACLRAWVHTCCSGIRNLFQAQQQRVAHGSDCPRSARVKSGEVTAVLTIFSSQNRINLV